MPPSSGGQHTLPDETVALIASLIRSDCLPNQVANTRSLMKRLLEVGSAEDLKRRKTPKLHQYWDSLGTQDLTIMLLRVLEEILKAPMSLSERTAQQQLLCRLGAPTIVLKFASCEVDEL